MPSAKGNTRAALAADLRLVPCHVEPGVFRGEYLVSLDGLDPANPNKTVHARLFADEREVRDIQGTPERGKAVPARLVVSLLGVDNGFAALILPQPAQPLGVQLLVKADKLLPEEVSV